MKKHQHPRRIATGNHGIFAGHAIHINGSEFHAVCNWPNSTNLVEPFSPCGPTNRPWLGTQECADSIDFALVHCLSSVKPPKSAFSSAEISGFRQCAELGILRTRSN